MLGVVVHLLAYLKCQGLNLTIFCFQTAQQRLKQSDSEWFLNILSNDIFRELILKLQKRSVGHGSGVVRSIRMSGADLRGAVTAVKGITVFQAVCQKRAPAWVGGNRADVMRTDPREHLPAQRAALCDKRRFHPPLDRAGGDSHLFPSHPSY